MSCNLYTITYIVVVFYYNAIEIIKCFYNIYNIYVKFFKVFKYPCEPPHNITVKNKTYLLSRYVDKVMANLSFNNNSVQEVALTIWCLRSFYRSF